MNATTAYNISRSQKATPPYVKGAGGLSQVDKELSLSALIRIIDTAQTFVRLQREQRRSQGIG